MMDDNVVDALKQATGTLVDCKSVFVIHVKSYKDNL
jgi:hypothetical protein